MGTVQITAQKELVFVVEIVRGRFWYRDLLGVKIPVVYKAGMWAVAADVLRDDGKKWRWIRDKDIAFLDNKGVKIKNRSDDNIAQDNQEDQLQLDNK